MTYPRYEPAGSRLYEFLRALSGSVRVGRCLGVEVRIYWIALVLVPWMFLSWIQPISAGFLEAMVLTAACFLGLFTIVWTHEMGHVLAGHHYGIQTPLITLSPLGGLAHMGAPASNPRMEVAISFAGPAVHLLWLAVCWPLRWLLPPGTVELSGFRNDPLAFLLYLLVELNFSLFWFNLLPIFPLDGGRVLRALLSFRLHPNRATMIATSVGLVGAGVFVLYGLTQRSIHGTVLVFLGISSIQACVSERRAARHVHVYDQSEREVREVWQSDPEAWRSGRSGFGGEQRQRSSPGWLARWRMRRGAAKAEQKRSADQAFERELDRVLERLHAIGMSQLSASERKVLQRAAERRRGAG